MPHAITRVALVAALALTTACKPRDTPEPPAPMPQGSSTVQPQTATLAGPSGASRSGPTAVDEPPEGVLRAYVWNCEGGRTLRTKNLYRENAITVEMHEGPRKLPLVVSASGAKYSDGSLTFWTKGGTATLERAGDPAVQCQEDRPGSIRADARERGVVVRGTGNEPGWMVEIGPGTRLLWLGDYGNDRREFEAAPSGSDPAGGITYTAGTDAGQIKVAVQKTPCTDDMSGEAFDHTMRVELEGRTLTGCATRLD